MTPLLVALGAAVGAPLRFALGRWLDTGHFPRGIWLANVLGSLMLGFLVGVDASGSVLALLGTGFCGAFTTYSAFAMRTWELGPRLGGWYAVATVAASLSACSAGFVLGQWLGQA